MDWTHTDRGDCLSTQRDDATELRREGRTGVVDDDRRILAWRPQRSGGASLDAATLPKEMHPARLLGLRLAAFRPQNCRAVVIMPPCPSLPPLDDGHAHLDRLLVSFVCARVARKNSQGATKLSFYWNASNSDKAPSKVGNDCAKLNHSHLCEFEYVPFTGGRQEPGGEFKLPRWIGPATATSRDLASICRGKSVVGL
jgi:hypothetical protein